MGQKIAAIAATKFLSIGKIFLKWVVRGKKNTSSVTAKAVPPSPRGRFWRDVEEEVNWPNGPRETGLGRAVPYEPKSITAAK